jgi:hypothetical protein
VADVLADERAALLPAPAGLEALFEGEDDAALGA